MRTVAVARTPLSSMIWTRRTILVGVLALTPSAGMSCDSAKCRAATGAMVSCIKRNAIRLDDGVSDAGVIAVAIRGVCDREAKQVVSTNEKEMGLVSAVQKQGFEEGYFPAMERTYRELSLMAVLDHRNGRLR